MRCVIKLNGIDKTTALDSCLMSCESQQVGNDTYLWYYTKGYANEDIKALSKKLEQKISFDRFTWRDAKFFSFLK